MKGFCYILPILLLILMKSANTYAKDTLRVKQNDFHVPSDTQAREIGKVQKNRTIQVKIFVKTPFKDSIDRNVMLIPFRLVGNLILVEAEVNENRGFFILDSGAPDLKLNAAHLQGGFTNISKEVGGITGAVNNLTLQTLRRFSWNHYEVRNVSVESFDLSHIEQAKEIKILGLIGYKVFKDLEILFDYKFSQLVLYKLDKKGNKLGKRDTDVLPCFTIPFRMSGHISVIRAKVGKYSLDFGLDTGAEMNILNIRVNPKILQNFTIQKRVLLNGNGKDKVEVLSGKLNELFIGDLKYTDMQTILANMESMNKVYNTNLDGILGFEFLFRKKTAINFLKKELYFWE